MLGAGVGVTGTFPPTPFPGDVCAQECSEYDLCLMLSSYRDRGQSAVKDKNSQPLKGKSGKVF
jgi:hypothetical protein